MKNIKENPDKKTNESLDKNANKSINQNANKNMEKAMWKKIQMRNMWDILWILFVMVLLQMVAYIVCSIVYYNGDFSVVYERVVATKNGDNTFIYFVSIVSAFLTLVYGVHKYHKKTEFDTEEEISFRFNFKGIFYLIFVGVGSSIILSFLLTFISGFAPEFFEKYNEKIDVMVVTGSIINLLYVIILGPVSEEVIFRGVIFKRTRFSFGLVAGNIIQAVIFGIFHGNIIQGIYTFILGLLMGYVVYKYKDVLSSIIAHIFFNVTSVLLSVLDKHNGITNYKEIISLIIIAGVILFLTGIYGIVKFKDEPKINN
ncbi:MAG: CPBP family intramembrane metalloprotease [Lachnospiraceae bacterium]|nr:CPBP family intramembrane metalloprotease [Lachnospiraceae bacterium]